MMTNEDVLNLIYEINDTLEYKVDEEGQVIVLEKQDHAIQNFFRKLKFKIPTYKKIILDESSSFIFSQIDGKKDVGELGKLIDEKYGENSHPLYERLLLFLNHIEVNCQYINRKI